LSWDRSPPDPPKIIHLRKCGYNSMDDKVNII
jgi:hypothetical protein